MSNLYELNERMDVLFERADRFMFQINQLKEAMGLNGQINISRVNAEYSNSYDTNYTNTSVNVVNDAMFDDLLDSTLPDQVDYRAEPSQIKDAFSGVQNASQDVNDVINSMDLDSILDDMGIDLSI